MDAHQIRETLLRHADETYRQFITALKPSRHRIIGVRMPVIRSIAKGFPDPLPYLHTFPFDPDPWYEEVLLASLLAGKLASRIKPSSFWIACFLERRVGDQRHALPIPWSDEKGSGRVLVLSEDKKHLRKSMGRTLRCRLFDGLVPG
jgi:hypothetical protein